MNGTTLRFINTLILILFCILGLTGLYGLVRPFPSSFFEIHRLAGWALIVLIPWKSVIALRSLGRGWNDRDGPRTLALRRARHPPCKAFR